jgi:hypothetical protein
MLTKRMMGLALAATLGLCAPAGAKDAGLDDAMLKAGAEIVLYYAVCTEKPLSPGARGSLIDIAGRYGEEPFKRNIESKVNALMLEWAKWPDFPKCTDARRHWGRGLLPEGERD